MVTPAERYGVLVVARRRFRAQAWIWSVPAPPTTMKSLRAIFSQALIAPEGVYVSSRISTSTVRPKNFFPLK